jgi:small conductance mechanosensitive channel
VALALRILKATAILVAAWFLGVFLSRVAARALRSTDVSHLLQDFAVLTTKRVVLLIGAVAAIGQFGVNLGPLMAAIGAAGLVIGLALQGTLSNIASGILIMINRPFDVDDIVSVGGVDGFVRRMTLVTTRIVTWDNQTIYVPNNKVWGDVIKNSTSNDTRRVDLVFGIAYAEDIRRAQKVLRDILTGHPKVLEDPEPNVRVHELADSSVNFVVRPWVAAGDYWDVYWDVTEAVKERFDAEGISIPFPQRDVHLFPSEAQAAASEDA